METIWKRGTDGLKEPKHLSVITCRQSLSLQLAGKVNMAAVFPLQNPQCIDGLVSGVIMQWETSICISQKKGKKDKKEITYIQTFGMYKTFKMIYM